jgi:hypothetical protein
MPTTTFHDLVEACGQPGCPVCRLEARTLERYISNVFYESVNDIKTREYLRGHLGLCREHAQLTVDKNLGNALGFAIIYQDVITNILRGFDKDAATPTSVRRLSSLLKQVPEQVSTAVQRVVYALTPHKHCIVCHQQDEVVKVIISELTKSLKEPELTKALQASEGLCIPHLKRAFESVRDSATFDLLLSVNREKLDGLLGELAEYIRKNDYRFQHEGFGAEGDSWLRAVNKLTGDRIYKNKKASEE